MPRLRIAALPVPGLVLFCLAAFGLGACGRGGKSGRIVASGHVEATDVRVASEVGGKLARVLVREGDRVAAGQLIAVIDTTELHLGVQAARAERDMAAAQLRLLENGPRREDVAAARARLESAQADLAGAENDLERMEALFKSGAAAAKARDDARTRRDVAAAAVTAVREQWKSLQAGSRIEDIEAARARLQTADAQLARIEHDLASATIESPTAGFVSEKLVEPGEVISPGTPVAVVTDLGDAWLTAYIAETDLARIRLGQPADVTTDDGQTRKGRVTFISTEAEFTPRNVQTRDERVKLVYEIKVTLPNQDGLFKPGMPAQATLLLADTTGAAAPRAMLLSADTAAGPPPGRREPTDTTGAAAGTVR